MASSETKGKLYLLIIAASAFLIGWAFNSFLKPAMIEAGCGQIASKSSVLYYKERSLVDPVYSYDNLKAKCLQDAGY